jgi:hypothetical protein
MKDLGTGVRQIKKIIPVRRLVTCEEDRQTNSLVQRLSVRLRYRLLLLSWRQTDIRNMFQRMICLSAPTDQVHLHAAASELTMADPMADRCRLRHKH